MISQVFFVGGARNRACSFCWENLETKQLLQYLFCSCHSACPPNFVFFARNANPANVFRSSTQLLKKSRVPTSRNMTYIKLLIAFSWQQNCSSAVAPFGTVLKPAVFSFSRSFHALSTHMLPSVGWSVHEILKCKVSKTKYTYWFWCGLCTMVSVYVRPPLDPILTRPSRNLFWQELRWVLGDAQEIVTSCRISPQSIIDCIYSLIHHIYNYQPPRLSLSHSLSPVQPG